MLHDRDASGSICNCQVSAGSIATFKTCLRFLTIGEGHFPKQLSHPFILALYPAHHRRTYPFCAQKHGTNRKTGGISSYPQGWLTVVFIWGSLLWHGVAAQLLSSFLGFKHWQHEMGRLSRRRRKCHSSLRKSLSSARSGFTTCLSE